MKTLLFMILIWSWNRNRNRNRNFFKSRNGTGTVTFQPGTVINGYGSTTLPKCRASQKCFKLLFYIFLRSIFIFGFEKAKDTDVDRNPLPVFFLEPSIVKMRLVVELFYVYDAGTAQSSNSKFF